MKNYFRQSFCTPTHFRQIVANIFHNANDARLSNASVGRKRNETAISPFGVGAPDERQLYVGGSITPRLIPLMCAPWGEDSRKPTDDDDG